MRFMMIMYPGEKPEQGILPDAQVFAAMGKYNEDLVKAGVLLAAEGLHPSSKGARIRWAGGKATVTDGPFPEAKEVIGGFWLIQVKSKAEAIEWASRCPGQDHEKIELRQVFELSDFPAELVQAESVKPFAEAERAFRERSKT